VRFLNEISRFLGLALLASTNFVHAKAASPDDWLAPFLQVGLPAEAISYAVTVLPADKAKDKGTHFGHRETVPMNPASTIKLVTTAAAMDLLGPEYRPVTRFYALGPVQKGVLKGGLGILGGGDPKLVVEDLQLVIAELKAKGIRRIEGRFVLDGSRYQEPLSDPSAFDGQPMKPYNVPPHAAMLNFKSVRLGLWTEKGKWQTVVEPALAGLRVEPQVRRVQGGCEKNQFDFSQRSSDVLQVRGQMGLKCPGFERYIALFDHAQFAYRLFAKAWRDAGGTISAKPEKAKIPEQAKLLVSWTSPRPMLELLSEINKRSNNPMARSVFLELSAAAQGGGTRADAVRRVKQWLTSQDLNFPEMVLDNGSGLSRHERIASANLTKLMVSRLSRPDPFPWIDTLALAGLEGTVRKRLKAQETVGRAWIKTGSLDDVRSVSGYALTDQGRWAVFTIFVNHPQAGLSKPVLDEFVQKLVSRY
jgi:D-alanyl-D-alanine carboxypeptidase/D-alanyl-D-alanine-endopeptidase (penicillin-binding protein 4)